jgi:hypothetical protein
MKCCEDVYNVGETSLFCCVMLDASLSWKCAAVYGSKKAVDCVIVLCCSNISETNKWKLVVFGEKD